MRLPTRLSRSTAASIGTCRSLEIDESPLPLPWSHTVGTNCGEPPKVSFLILRRKTNVSLTQAGEPAMGTSDSLREWT
jgi:hypothetical protein